MVGVVSSTPLAMACSCSVGIGLVGGREQLIAGDERHHLLG